MFLKLLKSYSSFSDLNYEQLFLFYKRIGSLIKIKSEVGFGNYKNSIIFILNHIRIVFIYFLDDLFLSNVKIKLF